MRIAKICLWILILSGTGLFALQLSAQDEEPGYFVTLFASDVKLHTQHQPIFLGEYVSLQTRGGNHELPYAVIESVYPFNLEKVLRNAKHNNVLRSFYRNFYAGSNNPLPPGFLPEHRRANKLKLLNEVKKLKRDLSRHEDQRLPENATAWLGIQLNIIKTALKGTHYEESLTACDDIIKYTQSRSIKTLRKMIVMLKDYPESVDRVVSIWNNNPGGYKATRKYFLKKHP